MSKPLLSKLILLPIILLLGSFIAKAQLVADFNASALTGCAPMAVTFTNTSTGGAVSYNWNDGNGNTFTIQNPGTTYLNAGVYTVTLTVTSAAGATSVKTKTITVVAKPTIVFSASPLAGCTPLNTTFTNSSVSGSGSITNYFWDFGDGTSSTVANPSHIYTQAGNNNVTLQITNSAGCINTLTKPNYVIAEAAVNALFTYVTPTGCGFPQTISFINSTTGGSGALSYLWDFGDGTTSTAFSPSHVFNAAGSYTIKLTATSASGCTNTYTFPTALLIGSVAASFTTPAINCINTSILFTNTSSPAPVSASWNFGDGTTSTSLNPVKSFSIAGVYPVTLISNFGGCQATTTQMVTVQPKPTASFTPSDLLSCKAPHTVNFTNSSVGATSYQWSFGDGATSTNANPSHTYTALGVYGVTLIATNATGCTDTLRFVDSVRVQKPIISIGNLPAQGCAPLTASLNAVVNGLTPVLSYQWQLGDGTTSTVPNPTHTWAAGSYDVQLVVNSAIGCSDTVKVIDGIKASTRPTASFVAAPLNTCAIIPVNFTSTSTGVNANTIYTWNFGDGTIGGGINNSHQYSDTGYFDIVLVVENAGCKDSISINDYVYIKAPIAKFDVINNCGANKFTKNFIDNSIAADTHFWEFGDGTTSTLVNPTHTYTAIGTYNVKLTVFNNSIGCSFDKTTSIVVSNEFPQFTANVLEMCRGGSTTFTATSINTPSGITAYYWNYGDGVLDTTNVRTHTYANPGAYDVKLIIADLNGCRDTLIKPDYIKVYGPTIGFGSNIPGTCPNSSITFLDQTITDGIHPIVNWTWDFGDGTPIITNGAATATHMYTASGIYNVTLTVTDSYGCSQSLVKPSFVTISSPVANFGSATLFTCQGQPVAFTDSSTGPGLTYLWNFGDGTTSASANPTHQYNADGNYTITLSITDIYGCNSIKVRNDYVNVNTPVASFTVSDSVGSCTQLNVQFTNTTNNIVSQIWDFGDGNTSSLQNPSHFYASPGTFIAKLTTTSVGGCISVKTKNIILRGPQGTFVYGPLTGCNQVTVSFVATTTDRTSFIWDYNDGTIVPTIDSMPAHTYTNIGTYVPKMILVGSAPGCTFPVTGLDTIRVIGVNGSFTPNVSNLCTSGDVTFTTTATSNDAIVSYAWNFGDGLTGTAQNPTHFYATTGIFNPTLQITTQAGCTKNITSAVPIRVVANPQPVITQPALICAPQNINFVGSLAVPDTSAIAWQWTLPNGTNANTASVNNYPVNTAGLNNLILTATNSTGCVGNANANFIAYPKPIVNAGNDITICRGTGLPLTATGADTYTWSPSVGLNTTIGNIVIATPDSVKNYVVTGTSTEGCVNRDTVNVAVKYPFKMQKSNGDTLCVGESGKLTATGAFSYNWFQNNFSPAQGLNSTTSSTVVANPTITTTYAVVGTDDKNCFKDTAFFFVKVYPIPTINAGIDKTLNVGQTATLTPTFSADVTNVNWTPNNWVVSSSYPSITIKPNMDQVYKVTAKNPGGCTSTDEINIFVLCDGSNFFIPNTFSPNGDGVNDKFFPRGTGLFTIKQLRVFNRWGEEVYAKYSFKANDETSGWDGKRNGQPMAIDTYVYMIEIQCLNNTTLVYKGNVALVK
jgi:gliding motility-associated-like protein